ncbi:alpha/beta hydrolase [Paraburkholderia sediminicola]|uniref:alpha/beta hydrolase n=1 Tax=Paraburkholderia sediminicola TaxID=458836 RepID=UPI0038BDE8ED
MPTHINEKIDLQYNARATVEDATVYIRQYREFTDEVKRKIPHLDGIFYGDTQEETLDIYPTNRRTAPVFVFIHGGYWRALSKSDSGFMAPTFTEAGAMVVALNYALAPASRLDAIVDQVRKALVWVFKNIEKYGGDPEQIYICGSSAGGHLVGMLLEDGWHEAHRVPLTIVKGAVPISGLFDLRPLVVTHINEWLRHDLADATRNSPMLRPGSLQCQLIIAFAERDTLEFKRQSNEYAETWRRKGNVVSVMDIPDTNHFDVLFELTKPDSSLFRAVISTMGLNFRD